MASKKMDGAGEKIWLEKISIANVGGAVSSKGGVVWNARTRAVVKECRSKNWALCRVGGTTNRKSILK